MQDSRGTQGGGRMPWRAFGKLCALVSPHLPSWSHALHTVLPQTHSDRALGSTDSLATQKLRKMEPPPALPALPLLDAQVGAVGSAPLGCRPQETSLERTEDTEAEAGGLKKEAFLPVAHSGSQACLLTPASGPCFGTYSQRQSRRMDTRTSVPPGEDF